MNNCDFKLVLKQQNERFPSKLEARTLMKQYYLESIDQASGYRGHYGVFHDYNNLPINHNPIEKISHHIWIRSHNAPKTISYNQLDRMVAAFTKREMDQEKIEQMLKPLFDKLNAKLAPLVKQSTEEGNPEELVKHLFRSLIKVDIQDELLNLANQITQEGVPSEEAANLVNSSFDEISNKDLDNLVEQINKMDSSNSEFKHIIWCNDLGLIPATIAALKDINIEVRDIKSLGAEIKNLDVIETLIEREIYGLAIDILKYEVIRIFGGLVVDLNYQLITDNLSHVLDSYNFFTHARWRLEDEDFQFENNMFAANKGHPILTEVCEQINMSLEFIKEHGYDSSCTQSDLVHELSYNQWQEVIFNNFKINDSSSIDEIFPGESECQRFDEHNVLTSNMVCNIIGVDGTEQSWNVDASF